ncbi:hypothetical protein HDZ31DRAFT_43229 [Schizophyllum fasciatum]
METPSRLRSVPGAFDASPYDFDASPPRFPGIPSPSPPSHTKTGRRKKDSSSLSPTGPSIFAPQIKPRLPRAPHTGLGYLASLADALPPIDSTRKDVHVPDRDDVSSRHARPTRGIPPQPPSARFPHAHTQPSARQTPKVSPAATPPLRPPSPQLAALRDREAAEAARGEQEWVLAGGILRDARGRRDHARTAAVRRQALERIRYEERERIKRGRWAAYEAQWGAVMQMPVGTVRFAHVPWPVFGIADDDSADEDSADPDPVMPGLFGAGVDASQEGWGGRVLRPEDITGEAVERFMRTAAEYATETVRSPSADKHALRDRVRRGLLRWHPDKLVAVLRRVSPEDSEAVERAARIVFSALQGMNEHIAS